MLQFWQKMKRICYCSWCGKLIRSGHLFRSTVLPPRDLFRSVGHPCLSLAYWMCCNLGFIRRQRVANLQACIWEFRSSGVKPWSVCVFDICRWLAFDALRVSASRRVLICWQGSDVLVWLLSCTVFVLAKALQSLMVLRCIFSWPCVSLFVYAHLVGS
jgi:hypothetical protein